MSKVYQKDPQATLDYLFDWAPLTNLRSGAISDWLRPGETLVSHEITIDDGLTLNSSAITNLSTSVLVWLSEGTPGTRYKVACKITTSSNRIDERTLYVNVLQR